VVLISIHVVLLVQLFYSFILLSLIRNKVFLSAFMLLWLLILLSFSWFSLSFLHCFSEETLAKEKIWSFISQNEPSLVPISLVTFHWLCFLSSFFLNVSCCFFFFLISHMVARRPQNCRMRIAWHVLIFLRCC
jgi:hypothetical protein